MAKAEVLPKFIKPDRNRVRDHPLIVLAQDQMKASHLQTTPENFWYISRILGFDYFLGIPSKVLDLQIMKNLTTNPSISRRCLANLETAFGDTVEAEVCGVINKNVLTMEQKEFISKYTNPFKKEPSNVHPEIFTFASTFNSSKYEWPMINSLRHIESLSMSDKENLLAELLVTGLGVLEFEADYKHINLAAKRLRILGESPKLGFHISSNITQTLKQERGVPIQNLKKLVPEQHSLVYFPNFEKNPSQIGEIIVPVSWMWAAFERPISALCSLLFASSLARDDFYHKLQGSQYFSARGLGIAEVSNQPVALKRAEGLVAELMEEVYQYDQLKYFMNPKSDEFMRKISSEYPLGARHTAHMYYDDPPENYKKVRILP